MALQSPGLLTVCRQSGVAGPQRGLFDFLDAFDFVIISDLQKSYTINTKNSHLPLTLDISILPHLLYHCLNRYMLFFF